MAVLVTGAAFVIQKHGIGEGNTEKTEFIIEKGQSLGTTARMLAERDLIYSRHLFVAYAILTGNEKKFKAGRYKILSPVSTRQLVEIFSQGRAEPEDLEVTIPEGTNIADIDKILASAGLIKAEELLAAALKEEGYLFPDTYRFGKSQIGKFEIRNSKFETNSNARNLKQGVEEIIRKMEENFKRKTDGIFRDLDSLKRKETVIIASILEKEVQTEQDMRLAAGIMNKRLELGVPLQVDATVAYGVCYQEFLRGRYCDVSQANIVDNLKVDSVYNTYVRKGLPVGPISNPGLVAVRSALNPQPSDYLYYLSARDGTTIFSKTAVEHERARAKYLNN